MHRSQNRIESYHQLRSTIAQVGGKKESTGRTDIEIEIGNQCARLIDNAIIYCNSAILSHLLTKCEASGNAKAVALITKICECRFILRWSMQGSFHRSVSVTRCVGDRVDRWYCDADGHKCKVAFGDQSACAA